MKALIPVLLLSLTACPAPGPLKADRDPNDLFGPSEDNVVVIDAILIVDATLPPIDLRRTAAPGTPYVREAMLRSRSAAVTMLFSSIFPTHRDQVAICHP